MSKEDRKAAVRAYKERKNEIGVFAIRCPQAGLVWVGATPTPDTVRNRIWFSLATGGDPHRDLQDAWKAHGADSFEFEELERTEVEVSGGGDAAYLRKALMTERAQEWRDRLGARAI